MAQLTAKSAYEKIVLHGLTPTPEHMAVIKGTHWENKLSGRTPAKKDVYKTFKTFFEEDAPVVSNEHKTRSEIAADITDKVEDRFNLHFSHTLTNDIDPAKLPAVKEYCNRLLSQTKGALGDLKAIAHAVNKANDIHRLLARLSMLAA